MKVTALVSGGNAGVYGYPNHGWLDTTDSASRQVSRARIKGRQLTTPSCGRMFCGNGRSPMMDEMTIRVAIRTTARISFVLFLGAFLSSAVYSLLPAASTRWLKANKDGLVLGFAASHTVHLAFILTLVAAIGREHALKGTMVVAFTTGSCSFMLWLLLFYFPISHSGHHGLRGWRTGI